MAQSGLHVGVVGVGRIGAFHAATLRTLPAVSRLTVADTDAARAAELARELDAETAPSVEALLDSGLDAVAVAAPTPAHAPLLKAIAAAGLPAFCEKPVALELEPLDSVIEEVERAGTLVQIGFQRRFDRGYLSARDAVSRGGVGDLLVLRGATHDPSPPSEAYIAASGGIFRDLHIHDFDAIRFVTGREIIDVYAAGAVRETRWFADHGDVDAAAVLLRLEDGTPAVLTGTRRDPLGYDVRLEVFGTEDSVAVGVDRRTPLRSVEAGESPVPDGYHDFLDRFSAAYRSELEAFIATVRDGGPSLCPLTEARAALAVALAADRSRAERRPVSIEEVTSAHALAR
jgi:myo-inositol 2-dehydrogenase / D-chiro-inositol 1-dehydrogenase